MDLSSIAYPKLEDIQSALFIQPHPDDNEIGAGGTMAYLSHQGIPVYGLTVTEGRGGSKTIEPEELGKIRKIEAQNAMDVLGVVNLGCLGYHDNRPIIHETLVKELVRIIREVKPQAIFTVDPQSGWSSCSGSLYAMRTDLLSICRSCETCRCIQSGYYRFLLHCR